MNNTQRLTAKEETLLHCALLEYREVVRSSKDDTGYFKPYKNGTKEVLQKKINALLKKI